MSRVQFGQRPTRLIGAVVVGVLILGVVVTIIAIRAQVGASPSACASSTALARIRGGEPTPTKGDLMVKRALSCSGVPASELSYIMHSGNVTVSDNLGDHPDPKTVRQTMITNTYLIQRALWLSPLDPAGVNVQVFSGTVVAWCGLGAPEAKRVDWSQETPEQAWTLAACAAG